MSSAVSPLALGRHQVGQGIHRPALIGMMVNTQPPGTSHTAPFPDQRHTPEEIALYRHQIETAHVPQRVLTVQMHPVRENLELHKMHYML